MFELAMITLSILALCGVIGAVPLAIVTLCYITLIVFVAIIKKINDR